MRSLTLAIALVESGCSASLVSRSLPVTLRERAGRYGVDVVDVIAPPYGADDAKALLAVDASFAVVDGYLFRKEFFDALVADGLRHLIIDDNHECQLETASVVLNQNLHAQQSQYSSLPSSARLLIGPQYALIRPEVVFASRQGRKSREMPRVLISVGGSDVLGLTPGLVSSLGRLTNVEVDVALADERMALPEIAERLAGADVAVIGAGTTMLEACCSGVARVVLAVADNQVASALLAERMGVVRLVDCRDQAPYSAVVEHVRVLLGNPDERRAMEAAGRRLIDGGGARRVADAVIECVRREVGQ